LEANVQTRTTKGLHISEKEGQYTGRPNEAHDAYKDGYVHDAPPRKRVRELDRLRKCGTARAYTGLEDGVIKPGGDIWIAE
jgi:hypothetical protein